MKLSRQTALAVAIACGAIAMVSAPLDAAEEPSMMQPGKWQSTTTFSKIDMPGMPPQVAGMMKKMMGRQQSVSYCVKPEDIGRPGPDAMGGKNAKDCKYEDWSYNGGRMRATIVCKVKGQGTMRMKMAGSGSPTAYNADVDTTITGSKMGPMHMVGKVSAKRIGSC
ncbi:DUF3617 domain-containing protein [Novosphingobium marinum]|uniref:DUF3617 domain-containing protein n=1 Tax=Novosphingobium marinum TaxID=1514948 RepID=A0A7Y9XV41_9SPHN|nr:DUF3617 domain-containing protein [Novosphingobium marinum]NYH95035.1 hypothetical protein [Novosphingobium marinum]